MLKLSKNDIRNSMIALKRRAENAYRKGDDTQAMHLIEVFASIVLPSLGFVISHLI